MWVVDYDKDGNQYIREFPREKKMEFDKSRIYSAVNADELRAGDKVIVANDTASLKEKVKEGGVACTITSILAEDWYGRFDIDGHNFALAYLVERKENCTNCENLLSSTEGECSCKISPRFVEYRTKPIDVIKCENWKPRIEKKECCLNCKHYNKVNNFRDCTLVNNPTGACPHYEAEKHYRPFRDTDELIKVWLDKGSKWQKRELTMPLIWVRRKDCNCKGQLITKFSDPSWVIMSTEGYNMTDLFVHFTFLDGSPCGVEE